MKHRHVTGHKRERRPNKRTQAQAGTLGAQIAATLSGKTPAQLMELAEQMLQPKGSEKMRIQKCGTL